MQTQSKRSKKHKVLLMHLVLALEPPANIFHHLALYKQSYEFKYCDGGCVFQRRRACVRACVLVPCDSVLG